MHKVGTARRRDPTRIKFIILPGSGISCLLVGKSVCWQEQGPTGRVLIGVLTGDWSRRARVNFCAYRRAAKPKRVVRHRADTTDIRNDKDTYYLNEWRPLTSKST